MVEIARYFRRWPRAVLLAFLVPVAAGLLLAACGDGPSQTSATADIAEVLDSGPDVVDITTHSASIVAVSEIDVVCAVAYGQTTDYGRTATDTDMAGGGHSDHHPMLIGLEPDTLYHYKIGGIGPDGTVYASRDYTFRTPPAEVPVSQGTAAEENLALLSKGARVVGVSSNFAGEDNDSTWGANNAIDGDPQTQWSTGGDGDGAWIEIELPGRTRITSIGFWTRTMGTSAQVFSFRVVSDDGTSAGPFRLDDASSVHNFPTELTATRLRFEAVDTSGGNVGAVEIAVYGEAAP